MNRQRSLSPILPAATGIPLSALNHLWRAAHTIKGDTIPEATSSAARKDSELRLWGLYPYRIIDLREPNAFLAGHLPETCSIPAVELEHRISELPPKWRTTIFVSDKPRVAKKIAANLTGRGWRQAIALVESVNKWNGPLEKGPTGASAWEPTPVLRQWAHRLKPGRCLDLGCGAGRDAVFLALRGGEVTAVDLLPDALAMAEQLAQRSGVTIAPRLMDLRKVVPPLNTGFDTILMLRFLQREMFPFLIKALRPEGILLLETFCFDPESEKQVRPSRRLESQELLRWFTGESAAAIAPAGMRILDYREYYDRSGKYVARLVALKE